MKKIVAIAIVSLSLGCSSLLGQSEAKFADAAETICESLEQFTPFVFSVEVIKTKIEEKDYKGAKDEALKLYDEYKDLLPFDSREMVELNALISVLRGL